MGEELVKRLWECASGECFNCSQYTPTTNASICQKELMKQAADAVEGLSREVEEYKAAYRKEHNKRIEVPESHQRRNEEWPRE